jgi:nucleoside-diphosphate-sugar epimerase
MRHLRSDVVVRALADCAIVNLSLFVGLVVRFFALPSLDGTPQANTIDLLATFADALSLYVRGAPILTVLTLGLFWVSGIYTRVRFFQPAYKVPRLVQVVTVSFALCGLVGGLLGPSMTLPRVALITAWALTLVLMIAARFWLSIWCQLLLAERSREDTAPRAVQTVLVIGGAGYIGSMLCRMLLDRGYQVRVLDALLYGNESIRELIGRPDFQFDEGDSRDITSLVHAVHGVDAVVHLGEIVGDPACALDEQVTLEINLAATHMAAEVAKGFGVRRFVYASSCSVYGASSGVIDERSELHPVSLYARTKIAAERQLLSMRGKAFHPVIVRLATVYGLSYRPRFDLVVNTLAGHAYVDGEISVFGGSQWRPLVHVRDVALALTLCLEKPIDAVDGQIFNVGSDAQNYTIEQVANLVAAELPGTRVCHTTSDTDQRDYRVSFAKIHGELGFRPRMTVADGIREIVDALRTGRLTGYRDPRHNNAQFLVTDYGSHRVRAFHAAPLYQPDRAAMDALLVAAPVQV